MMLFNLQFHLFSQAVVFCLGELFLKVTHAFVFQLELSLALCHFLLDLGVALLVHLSGLDEFVYLIVETFDLRAELVVLALQIACNLLVFFGF